MGGAPQLRAEASEVCVRAHAAPRLLCALRGAVRGYLDSAGLAQERQDAVVLAVDEACSNVVRHAYGSEASGAIELAIGQHDGWLQVEVVDWGTPAPPEALVPKPRSAPKRSTVKPGGLGLQLIHSVFDEVDYGRGDDGANVLRLRLRMPAAGQRENQCNGPDAETHGREQDHGA